MRPLRTVDSQGRQIRPGHKVAYNMSGDVVPGEVLGIRNSYIKVLCTSLHYKGMSHISKIRDGHSMLVLNDPDAPTYTFPVPR